MRPPPEADIVAPEFPRGLRWLNVSVVRMQTEIGRRATLIEFFDTARINSVRTRPYVNAWHERYAGAGLRVIGVHSPGYSFGRERDVVAGAVERLGVSYPVVLDPDFVVWREYGNRGWPGRYLFDHRGLLRYVHYGEGDYLDCEAAIGEVLSDLNEDFEPPPPLEPVRPEDAEGVLLEPQTADIALPADSERLTLVRDWLPGEDYLEAEDAGAAAEFSYSGGSAWAVLSGADRDPGLYEVSEGRVVADDPGVRLHGVQFTPKPP